MRNAIIIFVLLIAILLTACNSLNRAGADLEGEWTLTSLNSQTPIASTKVTAKFENNQVGGSAGCNSYGAEYRVDGDKITFSAIFQTEMACMDPEGVMNQESNYTQTLEQAVSFTLIDDKLQMQNADGVTILEFAK